MTKDEVLALVNAGYTKEDILAFDKPAETKTTSSNEEIADQIVKEMNEKSGEKVEETKESDLDLVKRLLSGVNIEKKIVEPKKEPDNVTLSSEQFKQLLQTSNLANRTIDLPKEDSWKEHFNAHVAELFGDSNKTKEV